MEIGENFVAVAGIGLVLGTLALVTTIIVVSIAQIFATKRASASAAREEAYRKLAEQAVTGLSETSEALADMRPRLAAIEKLLREVE